MINRLLGPLVVVLASGPVANADWQLVRLHPEWATQSILYGTRDGVQVGYVRTGAETNAGYWTGSAGSFVYLHDAESIAYATDSGMQGGYGIYNDPEASLWAGTPKSWVSLHPLVADAGKSFVYAMHNGQQVGMSIVGGVLRASLWTGTALSWVSLHPSGATGSWARGVYDGQQVGQAQYGSNFYAGRWSGTAASWVNLSPIGATFSDAMGVYDGQQVGYARILGVDRACRWSGTFQSWWDMHPPTCEWSYAASVWDGIQAGYAGAGTNGRSHASVWTGTADSWVDLHPYLPAGFTLESHARAIWSDGQNTYVAGSARNTLPARTEAMLWVAAHNFGPSGYSIVRGNLVSGGLPELQSSDDQRLRVRNGLVLSPAEPPINVVFEAVSPFAKVAELKLRLETTVSTPGLEQIVDLFDYIGNAWSTVDTRTASFGSDSVAVIALADHNRFINPTTRVMQARVRYRRAGLTLSSTWVAGFDQVQWELDPS